MNKGDLIDRIAVHAGIRRADASAALDATLYAIQEALCRGEKVTLVNFGTLLPAYRAPRRGFNPSNKNPVAIDEKVIVKFKTGKLLSDAINNPTLLQKLKEAR